LVPNFDVILSSLGAEGMIPQNNSWGGFIADSEEEIVRMAVKLYEDEGVWKNAQRTGLEIIKELFDQEKNFAKVVEVLLETSRSLKEIRRNNYFGEILW
jgi:hypothetical protein